MYQGNWTCSTCEGSITELPFEPRSEKGLTCRACFMKKKSGDTQPTQSTSQPSATSTEMPPDDVPDEASLASEPQMDDGFADATPMSPGEKPKFEGNWECATCGGSITSLPFEPRNTNNLKCLECFKASR